MKFDTVLLSQKEIESLITMKDVVECVDKTFRGMGDGTVINPAKVTLDLGEKSSYPQYQAGLNAMPAYIGWSDTAGIKWAGGFLGERRKQGLPFLTAMIMLIDPRVGNFRAVMEGAYITNMRTGAQSAVALKYMYSKGKKLKLGLYGAGVQSYTQTAAISELFEIEEIKVYDINPAASERFASEMKGHTKNGITVVRDPREAAEGADVCVCVTISRDHFFKYDWFKPGMYLLPLGSYQECEDDCILKCDRLIVDHVEQTLHRGAIADLAAAGKVSESDIFATIGELAAGKKTLNEADSRIVCVPIGTGAMDIGVASVVYQRAVEKNVGGKFAFVEY